MERRISTDNLMAMNIRLAVREAVIDLCSKPGRTLKEIRNQQIDRNEMNPTKQLVLMHLDNIYHRLQRELLLPFDEYPQPGSLLNFVTLSSEETVNDIIRRFEKVSQPFCKQKHIGQQHHQLSPVSMIRIPPVPSTVPPLDPRALADSSTDSDNRRKEAKEELKRAVPIVKIQSTFKTPTSSSSSPRCVWSKSSQTSAIADESIPWENGSRRAEVLETTDKITSKEDSHREEAIKSDDEALLNKIRQATADAASVILRKDDIIESMPTFSMSSANKPHSNRSKRCTNSPYHSEDRITVRFVDRSVATADVGVVTESPVKTEMPKVDVGVNTNLTDRISNRVDRSSSSNTTSDLSVGQLPARLYDAVLRRPTVQIVSMRADGSVVTKKDIERIMPSVREWTPSKHEWRKVAPDLIDSSSNMPNSEPSENEKLETVSALSSSRTAVSEDESNTMANISPIPPS